MSVCKLTLLLDTEEVCVSLSLCVTRADPEQEGKMRQTVSSLRHTPFCLK